MRKYGSQGQQKSFLIALKLAQYTIVAQEKGEKPILLLDDLFDKLDAGRVEQLIRLVSEDSFGQIVITDCNPTRLRRILDKAGGAYSLFTVENGGIGQETATAGAPACGGQLPAEERAKEAADRTRHAGPQEAGAAEGIRTAAVQGEASEDLRNAASAGEKIRRKGRPRNRYGRHGIRRKGGSAMRRTKTMLMGDLLEEFFKRPYVAAKVAEGKLPDTWRAVVGDRAADFTTELKLENHILYARIQSSVLRSELFYQREALRGGAKPAFRRPDRQCGDYPVDSRKVRATQMTQVNTGNTEGAGDTGGAKKYWSNGK